MRRSHLFSLENETLSTPTPVEPIAEAQPPVVETSTADEAPLEEPVDSSISEDAIAPVETIVEQIEDASDVSDVLEDFSEILARGPVSEQTAEVMAIATEHFMGRIGFANPAPLPALESFSSARAKTTTRFALESMQENIKAIRAKIIEAIKNALLLLKQFIRQLTDKTVHLGKRISELRKKVFNGKPSAKYTDTVGRALQIQGVVPVNLGLEAQRTNVALEAYFQGSDTQTRLATLFASTEDKVDSFTFDAGRDSQAFKLSDTMKDMTGGNMACTPELLGGRTIGRYSASAPLLKGPEAGKAALDTPWLMTHSSSVEYQPHNNQHLELDNTKSILDEAGKMVEHARGFQKNLSAYEKQATAALKAANEIEGVETIRSTYLRSVPRMLVKEPTQVANYALKTANALIDYVEQVNGVTVA